MSEMIDLSTRQGRVSLTTEQKDFVKDNPAGYTREGIQEEIKNWSLSNNKRQVEMFRRMLNSKSLLPSETVDGKVVLAKPLKKVMNERTGKFEMERVIDWTKPEELSSDVRKKIKEEVTKIKEEVKKPIIKV